MAAIAKYHQPQRKLQDHRLVAQQSVLWNTPAIEKQQRRKKQQKENLRIQHHAVIEHAGNARAHRDLHQRQRYRQDTHHIAAGHYGQQHRQHQFYRIDRFPRPIKLRLPSSSSQTNHRAYFKPRANALWQSRSVLCVPAPASSKRCATVAARRSL
ncbi:Ni/Co efflux regulator RcnB [Rhodanobacter sp. ANJX3]|nr:Ni/Co efflux regulator RcnB [Rhodanobacter sp. ANJX3]